VLDQANKRSIPSLCLGIVRPFLPKDDRCALFGVAIFNVQTLAIETNDVTGLPVISPLLIRAHCCRVVICGGGTKVFFVLKIIPKNWTGNLFG
jgi:hypothetical protein